MSEVITTVGLTKIFRDFWGRRKVTAVDNLDLSVGAGEVYGMLGPNGSGKSTIMKLLLGLLHPTAGSVSMFEKPPTHTATRRKVGYLPEESQLYRNLTAVETLHFYGRLFGLAAPEIRERSRQLIEMVGLADAAARPVGTYSKGMARRIGLAQSLINDPDLLILDEPTAGLDPIGCRQMKDLLHALAQRGKTVVVSSHLLADMEDVCDRIMLLHNGRALAQGAIDELLRRDDGICFSFTGITKEQQKQLREKFNKVNGLVPQIAPPRIGLEKFFVDTIATAGEAGNQNARPGVRQTVELAPFIRATGT